MNKTPIALLIAFYASASTVAAPTESSRNDLGGALFVTAAQSDNALKSSDTEPQIKEQQNQLGAQVFALYENDYLTLDSDYSLSESRYEKESQQDRTTTIGRTDLTIGKSHHLFDLKLSHSREKLPKYSGALDLESNQDEKQLLSVQPGFHTRLTPADMLLINVSATEVDYRFEELKNSSRKGGYIGLIHGFSAIDALSLYVSDTDIEFEFNPQIDYRMTIAVVAFESRLRKLNYKVELGQTRTDSNNAGKSDDPYYQLKAKYQGGYNQLDFSLGQRMTDSSFGVDSDLGGGELNGGAADISAEQLDQILLQRAEVRWTSDAICGVCSFYLNVFMDDQDYQTLARDEKNNGAGLGFSYQLSRAATLGLSASRMTEELTQAATDTEYTLDQLTAYFNYNFVSDFNIRVFVTENERSSLELNDEYKELRAGATLGYRF